MPDSMQFPTRVLKAALFPFPWGAGFQCIPHSLQTCFPTEKMPRIKIQPRAPGRKSPACSLYPCPSSQDPGHVSKHKDPLPLL